jgi:superfamily II DNA/RNA helicase
VSLVEHCRTVLSNRNTFLSVRHLVLDEADRLLDSEFLSQVREIVASCTHENLRKSVFSATLPAGAEKIAMEMLRDPIRIVVGLKYVFLYSFPIVISNIYV